MAAMGLMQKRVEDEAKQFQNMQKGEPASGAVPAAITHDVACCEDMLVRLAGVWVGVAETCICYFSRAVVCVCVCPLCPLLSPLLPSCPRAPEHSKMGQAFSKLMAQHNENEMVLAELKILKDDSKVYKLVGPVLLNQVRGGNSPSEYTPLFRRSITLPLFPNLIPFLRSSGQ